MVLVHGKLYLSDNHFDFAKARALEDFSILCCAKEPYHRAMVGYSTRACPIDSPNYLFIRERNIMALNMVDAPDPRYFSTDMIDGGLDFIDDALKNGRKVLALCNQQLSRSPSVILLYLAHRLKIWDDCTFEEALDEFLKLYPIYDPGYGITLHMKGNWWRYQMGGRPMP